MSDVEACSNGTLIGMACLHKGAFSYFFYIYTLNIELVSAVLTYTDVSGNDIGDEGMLAIGNALLSSTTSKLGALKCDAFDLPLTATSLDFSGSRLGSAAATLLAGVIKFSAVLTTLL